MNLLGLLISLLLCAYSKARSPCVFGYYWREYDGEIPSDALVVENDGQKVYIGQALHSQPTYGKLMVGTIEPGKGTKMEYYWNYGGKKVYEVTDNIKILCTQDNGAVSWDHVPDMESIESLNPEGLVIGGYDGGIDGYNLYVGKVVRDGKPIIGKVTLYKDYEGMGYVDNGVGELTKNDLQILSFKKNIIH